MATANLRDFIAGDVDSRNQGHQVLSGSIMANFDQPVRCFGICLWGCPKQGGQRRRQVAGAGQFGLVRSAWLVFVALQQSPPPFRQLVGSFSLTRFARKPFAANGDCHSLFRSQEDAPLHVDGTDSNLGMISGEASVVFTGIIAQDGAEVQFADHVGEEASHVVFR